ncbi:MAG: hypothetical protein IKR77_05885, partial [Bacteroidales bacterium]|nr:hypothetical protein [Bacteroidales bacterium]
LPRPLGTPSENQKGNWRLVARKCHRMMGDVVSPVLFVFLGQQLYHYLIFIHFVFLQRTILLISNEQLYNRLKNMILQQTIEQAIPQNTQ